MVQSKKVVLVVAIVLGLLTLIPVALIVLSPNFGPASGGHALGVVDFPRAPASYELQELQGQAVQLLEHGLAPAFQDQRLSLEVMTRLQALRKQGDAAMQQGAWGQAQQAYQGLVDQAQVQLEQLQLVADCVQKERALYVMLGQLTPYRSIFENTYQQLVQGYDAAGNACKQNDFLQALELYTSTIDQAKEAQRHTERYLDTLVVSAKEALMALDLSPAAAQYQAILNLVADFPDAQSAAVVIDQLRPLQANLEQAKGLESRGEWSEALKIWEKLLMRHPACAPLLVRQAQAQEKVQALRYARAVELAEAALAEGALKQAIQLFQEADVIQASAEIKKRVKALKEQLRERELEVQLQAAFQLLEIGQYAQARQCYSAIQANYPQSAEAQAGLEQASRLYLAQVNYQQNLQSCERYHAAGKFPLATKFFNTALASRPSQLNAVARAKEAAMHERLQAQLKTQSVAFISDGRTHVSVVGVLAPLQFDRKVLQLLPDVYQINGERPGYQPVALELKLNALQDLQQIRIVCQEKL